MRKCSSVTFGALVALLVCNLLAWVYLFAMSGKLPRSMSGPTYRLLLHRKRISQIRDGGGGTFGVDDFDARDGTSDAAGVDPDYWSWSRVRRGDTIWAAHRAGVLAGQAGGAGGTAGQAGGAGVLAGQAAERWDSTGAGGVVPPGHHRSGGSTVPHGVDARDSRDDGRHTVESLTRLFEEDIDDDDANDDGDVDGGGAADDDGLSASTVGQSSRAVGEHARMQRSGGTVPAGHGSTQAGQDRRIMLPPPLASGPRARVETPMMRRLVPKGVQLGGGPRVSPSAAAEQRVFSPAAAAAAEQRRRKSRGLVAEVPLSSFADADPQVRAYDRQLNFGNFMPSLALLEGQLSRIEADSKDVAFLGRHTLQRPQVVDFTEYPFKEVAANQTEWPLWWFAPFFDRTSFGKEAATTVLGVLRAQAIQPSNLWVGTTQGRCSDEVDASMPLPDFQMLDAAKRRANKTHAAIVVCHSLPPFWARPKNKWESCAPCPPVGYKAAYAVGRAMAETDLYHPEFVRICQTMDEVWVPSTFSRDVLVASGVSPQKLRVVPIAVNTTLFDPAAYTPLPLPVGHLVFGRHHRPVDSNNKIQFVEDAVDSNSDLMAGRDRLDPADMLQIEETLKRLGRGEVGGAAAADDNARADAQLALGASKAHLSKSSASEATVPSNPSAPSTAAGGPVSISRSRSSTTHRRARHLLRQLDERLPSGAARPTAAPTSAAHAQLDSNILEIKSTPFTLVSTFKWETRKGWDILLHAYLSEFTSEDNIELYILTKPFMTGSDFVGDMHVWSDRHLSTTNETRALLPSLYVISGHVETRHYGGLYKAADAFVMATRGEGWGMPITEAMSMGLPVIVTNWSGVTAFVDDSVGYLVDYDLVPVPPHEPWWFRGARWAECRVSHLQRLLRHVYEHRAEARAKGRRARERMVTKYSPQVIAQQVAAEHARITAWLKEGHRGDTSHNAEPGDCSPDLYTGAESFLAEPPPPPQPPAPPQVPASPWPDEEG